LSVGAWRSLVARLLGVQEVAGSNPVAPTSFIREFLLTIGFVLGAEARLSIIF
jgi:hypothetical protein